MITTRLCTSSDYASVATLWNARRLDPNSCWSIAEATDDAYVGLLAVMGTTIYLALDDETPVGFGLWFGRADAFQLVGFVADDDAVYYRLMVAYCDAGLALGATSGFGDLGMAMTAERARMDALAVITFEPIGFEPLAPGGDPANRVPRVLRAECDLAVLRQAALQFLETLP